MPALRTRDTQSRPLEVSTDAPQPPTLTIISPTPRTFNFPISHTLNDSPSSTPSSSPFEPDHRLSLSCITPPLMRNLSPDSISSASPAPSTPKRRKSSTGPSGTSPDAERRPRKGDQDYIKRPENAFILFRRSRCESRQLDTDSASDNTSPSAATKKQRQADLSKTISQQWKSLSPEERQHWERLAKQKKKEHEERYPDYVYRPQRVKDRDGKVRNKKRQPKQQVTVHEFSPLATSPAEAGDGYHNFVVPAPRQHGRSASAPTPPPMHYQAIQIPRMPQIVASPSCPASPSLIASPTSSEVPPMISRRATDAFDYQHLMPPAFSQAGYEFQSSDYLRSMFNIPHSDPNAISPSSTTVPTPSEHATPIGLPPQIHTSGLLPSPNIISPASASSGCSSGPTSPSHFLSQPDFQPQIHGQGYEYSPNSYPPEYSQFPDMSKFYMPQSFVEYNDYAEVPDFQQPEGYTYTWDSENAFSGSAMGTSSTSTFGMEGEFDLGSIPPCEFGFVQQKHETEMQSQTVGVARPLEGVEGGLEVDFQGMGSEVMEIDMEGNPIMSMGSLSLGMNMMGNFDEMMTSPTATMNEGYN